MNALPPFDDRKIADALLRASFFAFAWRVFDTLHPAADQPFIPNWHVEAICHALDTVRLGECRRLVITNPPRYLKSITAAVAWSAFLLGHDPACQILVASYALDLARKHSDDFRTILESDWYRQLFPQTRIAARGTRGEENRTTRGGGRKAVSTGGTVTGFGATVVIVDDPIKAQDATSQTERERAKNFLDNALLTRFNNPDEARVVTIQQRLHEDDPAGYLLSKRIYQHLNLPAIAEEDSSVAIGPGRMHLRVRGTPLFPQRFSLAKLHELRRDSGSPAFMMQYQQDPIAAGGSPLRWEWFRVYHDRPERTWFQYVVQSWDTGMSADPHSDFSVCMIWGFRENLWYVLDVQRMRLDYPELKRTILSLGEEWKADIVLIEKAGSGIPLLQECRRVKPARFEKSIPCVDKPVRFDAACAVIEDGRVVLPREAPWLKDFRSEITGFLRTKHDDQADSMSQFLNWAINQRFRRMHNASEQRAGRDTRIRR